MFSRTSLTFRVMIFRVNNTTYHFLPIGRDVETASKACEPHFSTVLRGL